MPKLLLSAFLLFFCGGAQPAFSQACIPDKDGRFFCEAAPTKGGWPKLLQKNCNRRCERVSARTVTHPTGGGIGAEQVQLSGSLIEVSDAPNPPWREAYREKGLETKDGYTTFGVELKTLPVAGSCQSAGFGSNFLRTLFGAASTDEMVLTLMVSEKPILTSGFRVQGYAIPVFRMKRTTDKGCQYERIVNTDLRIARVRSEDNKHLHVYVGFTASDGRTIFTDIAAKAESGILVEVLNGTLKQATTMISATLGQQGLKSERSEVLGAETSLPLTPSEFNEGAEARELRVVFDGTPIIEFRIFQEPDIAEEGELKGANSLESGLREARIADFDNATFTSREYRLIDQTGVQGISIGLLTDPAKPPSMRDMREVCGQLKMLFADYGFSHKAQNLLFALAMQKYPNPAEFFARANRNVCLPYGDLKNTDYQQIYMQTGPSSFQSTNTQGGPSGTNRHCPATSEWIGDWVKYARFLLRQEQSDRLTPGHALARLTTFGLAVTIEDGERDTHDLLSRVLQEITSPARDRCYLPLDYYGHSPKPSGSCQFLIYTSHSENAGHWTKVEFWQNQSGMPQLGRVTAGVFPETFLDVSLVTRPDCKAATQSVQQ